MASLKRLSILGISILLTVAAVSIVMAQTGTGGASPMYDVKTETTIRGTVERVDTVTGAGGRGRHALGGTHLMVKTEKEALAVHVGPTAYLAEGDHVCQGRHARDSRLANNDREGACRYRQADQERRQRVDSA